MLHTLGIHHINFDIYSLVALPNHCPSLVRIDLNCSNLTLNLTVIRTLHPMSCLHFFSLLELLKQFPALENLSIQESQSSPKELKDNFLYPRQLSHLELSGLLWNYNSIEETDKEAAVSRFIERLACSSKLEVFLSDNVNLGYQSMCTIAMVPTLKELCVPLNPTMQDSELLTRFQLIANTAFKELTIYNFKDLIFTLLDTLAGFSLLNRLAVFRNLSYVSATVLVSKTGLQQALLKTSSLVDITFITITIDGVEEALSSLDQMIYDLINK